MFALMSCEESVAPGPVLGVASLRSAPLALGPGGPGVYVLLDALNVSECFECE